MNAGISLTNLLVIDIETVPEYPQFDLLPDAVKILWGDKISKTVPENTPLEESYASRAGILGEFGRIVCISMGYFFEDQHHNLAFKVKSICCDGEKELLQSFIQITNTFSKSHTLFRFAGHNIREFDIPFICRRLLINQMELPPYLQLHGAKPWEKDMVDTLQWWKFGDYKNYISLNLLAHVLQVPTSKGDMDGSKVRTVYYEEHDIARIAAYCEKDVVVVANVLLRFNHQPLLKDEQVHVSK